MLRKLFILLCLVCTVKAGAQQTYSTRSKITEKKADPQIDYKLTGAAMPPLRLFLYHDSAEKRMLNDQASHDDRKESRRKHKDVPTDIRSKLFITNEDVDNGANLFVMIFNPTCSHCEDETVLLEKNMSLFTKSKLILMATPVMEPYLPDFVKLMKLSDYPSIILGVDSSGFMNNVFMYQALPQINIYNRERKLLKTYSGEVSIDTLKQYIE